MMNPNSEIAKKLKLFSQQIVLYPKYRMALEMIELGYESTCIRGIPTSTLVSGPSGAGKTTLLFHFKGRFPDPTIKSSTKGVQRIIPAFYCKVPARVTIKDLAKTLLNKLHVEDTEGSTADLTLRVIKAIKHCETKVILLDEIQLFLNKRQSKDIEECLTWLFSIIDQVDIPIILSGALDCEEPIYNMDVMARRNPFHATLSWFEYDSPDYENTLQKLDRKMYEIFELSKGAHLTDPTIITPLYVASSGNFEYLRQIIYLALRQHLHDSTLILKKEHFEKAAQLLKLKFNLAARANPFLLGLSRCHELIGEHQDAILKLRGTLAAG